MTTHPTHRHKHVGIGCRIAQDIPVAWPASFSPEGAEMMGRKSKISAMFEARFNGMVSQVLRCYADPRIPGSNSSWADQIDVEVTTQAIRLRVGNPA
jgi:hypothetical protein